MISMDKKYKTRDGRPVRLLCVDRAGGHPVVALVGFSGQDTVSSYLPSGARFADGEYNESVLDLIEVPKTVTKTVYIVPYDFGGKTYFQALGSKEAVQNWVNSRCGFYKNIGPVIEQEITYEVPA